MDIHESKDDVLALSREEIKILSCYVEERDQNLSSMDRLRVHRVSQDPFTFEYGSIWEMYNRRLMLDLETFRRHIASIKAWNSIIPERINKKDSDGLSIDVLIRDYVQPQIYYLIDAPQAINNQITQAVLRLNILWEDPSLHWEEMQRAVDGIKSDVYKKAKELALNCNEWEELDSALDILHKNESAKYLQGLHGDKYHNITSPPFVAFPVPWQKTLSSGVTAFGFSEDTLDIDKLVKCAIAQLKNAHEAYERFYAYADRLYAECVKKVGGVIIHN